MIARLKGILDETTKEGVIVDVNGVGYFVHITTADQRRLPKIGEAITFDVHTHVREDAFDLFGFLTKLDRALFAFVMEANGVGPKLALTVLSHLEGDALLTALRSGDIRLLATIPGIGKKKAERIVLELQDKCEKRFGEIIATRGAGKTRTQAGAANVSASEWSEDLMAALMGLGYREMDIRRAIAHVANQEKQPVNLEAYLKDCLKFLSQNNARALSGNA